MAFSWRAIFSLRRTSSEEATYAKRGFSFTAGVAVSDETSMKVSAFYRGVMYISTQIAKLPWDVKDKTNTVQDDALSRLLNLQPNPEMNAMTFRIWAIYNAIVYGNSYAEIDRNILGQPIALWPLNSRNVEPIRDTKGKLFYKVSGENSSETGQIYLDPKDVFHIKNFHTKDGIVGQGVVAYASQTLGISVGADRMAGNLFGNGGIPSGVLKHKGTLSDEAYKRLKESWREQHQGEKSGGVALLEEGTEFEPLNLDPTVLQFLESRKFSVIEISRFLGLPPTKLFDISAATYSNVENANLEVATDTLDAWACNLEMEADVKLLNLRYGGKYTELDLYSVFRGDMAARGNYFKTMMSVGAMTPNQIRTREGLPPYQEGDRYYIATNNFSPADRIDEIVDAQIKGSLPTTKSPVKQPTTDKDPEETAALEKAAISYLTRR